MANSASMQFEPDRDIPNLAGKVIVITGGTAGLGQATINNLIQHGSPRILFTGRNEESARETIRAAAAINSKSDVRFVRCDMNDLADMKAAASQIVSLSDRVDLVFCNAGVMATSAGLSKDGFENQFATNHLGHAMLVRGLLPALEKTAKEPGSDVRVIFNTSTGYMFADKIVYDTIRTKQESMILGSFKRYGQSKLANILYPAELARKYPRIIFVSIHPGVINTGLVKSLSMFNWLFTNLMTYSIQVSIEEGVKNQLWAATGPKGDIVNGLFYEPVGKPGNMTPAAKDEKLASELFSWTNDVLSKF